MAFEQKLQLGLSQKLILTPALQQAIKLLPMTTLELVDLLNQEVVENPLLDELSADDLRTSDAEAQVEEADPEPDPVADSQQDTWDDADFAYFFGDYLDPGYRPRTPREFKELPPLENTLSKRASLTDHLTWQLSALSTDDRAKRIGIAIVGNLDDDGYLVASIDEIVAMTECSTLDVERILTVVQACDPIGVAARDLRECLLLQLRHLELADAISETIVKDHLGLLEKHRFAELSRRLGLPSDDLKDYIDIIRRLDPKPGARFNSSPSHYVIPDVYVRKEEGEYVVVLNDEGMPQLRISPVYRQMLRKDGQQSEETRSYVRDKFRSALWLLKSIDQRQKTIFKVATSIVSFQREFLDDGIDALRPLVLKDVANDIDMHESTVSRVVSNKHMHTPRGVFELKYFFHSGIPSVSGESVSSLRIKLRIRQLVQAEDGQRPLSDSRIVNILREEGVVLARRTIAKYRDEGKIPTSSRRRVVAD